VQDLRSLTKGLVPQVQELRDETARIAGEASRLGAVRTDLDATSEAARTLATQVARIAEAQPAIDEALRGVQALGGVEAQVSEARSQAQIAHEELSRMIAAQAETHRWLGATERALSEMRGQVGTLSDLAPTLTRVEKQASLIHDSLSTIEARREFVEDLHRRLAECGARGEDLDAHGRELATRMDAAEARFTNLTARSEEADRIAQTIADVEASVTQSERKATTTAEAVNAIESRAESIEALAAKSATLHKELGQRQKAIAAAAQDLERATALRKDAADVAETLGTLAESLATTLSHTEKRAKQVDGLSSGLEARVQKLTLVDRRLGEFETRLAEWEHVEEAVSRALEQIASRQGTVQALEADLDRMRTLAEATSADVRTITSAHAELADSRGLLHEVQGRLQEIRDIADALEERERQMTRAEDRLARADGLLTDVRSNLESLQGQKTLVDQAVERVSSLRFLLKQAEAMIDGLREERKMTASVHDAVAVAAGEDATDDDDADGAPAAKAA
jgi:chromosome segregation ATPase